VFSLDFTLPDFTCRSPHRVLSDQQPDDSKQLRDSDVGLREAIRRVRKAVVGDQLGCRAKPTPLLRSCSYMRGHFQWGI
jgi:hypothetical protein